VKSNIKSFFFPYIFGFFSPWQRWKVLRKKQFVNYGTLLGFFQFISISDNLRLSKSERRAKTKVEKNNNFTTSVQNNPGMEPWEVKTIEKNRACPAENGGSENRSLFLTLSRPLSKK
jgi:hypothetical protein